MASKVEKSQNFSQFSFIRGFGLTYLIFITHLLVSVHILRVWPAACRLTRAHFFKLIQSLFKFN